MVYGQYSSIAVVGMGYGRPYVCVNIHNYKGLRYNYHSSYNQPHKFCIY